MVNPSSKGVDVPFTAQLRYVTEKFRLFSEDKDECRKLFDGSRELVKCMHGYALGYLRHLRAFNFNVRYSLAELINVFLSMLLEDPYESLTKLHKLEQAFEAAVKHIVFKAENDPNL